MTLPVEAAKNDQLTKLLAGGTPASSSPAPAGAQPGGGSPTAMALKSASDQLDGANPQGTIQVLSQMNSDLAQLYLMSANRAPDATKDLDTARQAIARAQKVFQKMAATQVAVAPIVNSAGIGPPVNAPNNGLPDLSALMQQS